MCVEGVGRSQDILPYRVMYEPVPEGMHQGMHCPPHELNAMLDTYYALRGWSPEGIPTRRIDVPGPNRDRWATRVRHAASR